MAAGTILGHRNVTVVKDSEGCRWVVSNTKGDVLFYVHFLHAFAWKKLLADKKTDLYAALYTAVCYEPLTQQDIDNAQRRWPSLQQEELLEVDPRDRPRVSYPVVPEKKTVAKPLVQTINTGPRRIK